MSSIVSSAVNLATRGILSNEAALIGVAGRILEDLEVIAIKIINRITELQFVNEFNYFSLLGTQVDLISEFQNDISINIINSIGNLLNFTTELQKEININTTLINNSLFI